MFNKVTAHPKKSRTSKTCHVVLVPLVQSRSQVAPDTKTSREKAGAARSMPAHSDDGLTEKSIDVLFRAALEVVADNFNAAEHLPKPVYDFLLPVATSSCQGLYATAMLFLGSMPALANGASVQLWTQKPSAFSIDGASHGSRAKREIPDSTKLSSCSSKQPMMSWKIWPR